MWWKTTQNTLPIGLKILSIILYSDATNYNILDKSCNILFNIKLMNSKYPCYFCLVSRDDLANTMLSKHDYETRNHKNMQNYYNNNKEKSVCIELVPNIFWNFK